MKEKKDNKRRAEAFLKQEMDKPEKIQDHHLTGTDQPFLPFMEQWLNEVERYSIRVTTLEQYKADVYKRQVVGAGAVAVERVAVGVCHGGGYKGHKVDFVL